MSEQFEHDPAVVVKKDVLEDADVREIMRRAGYEKQFDRWLSKRKISWREQGWLDASTFLQLTLWHRFAGRKLRSTTPAQKALEALREDPENS